VIKGAQCPAVLIEVEFLSNETGESLLKSASFRQKAAVALVEAMLNFKKKMEASEKWSK
jgi:N-acetylmuramoyl-L-alanine amidase